MRLPGLAVEDMHASGGGFGLWDGPAQALKTFVRLR